MQPMSELSILYKTIKWLSESRSFHICIHDTSGVIHENPSLFIPFLHHTHTADFCKLAKSTPTGLRNCMKCKTFSIRKALREGKTYIGECYMGVTEIVHPVFHNEKLLCIIYLSNLRHSTRSKSAYAIEKNCCITGVDFKQISHSLKLLEVVDTVMLDEYREVADILSYIILSSVSSSFKKRSTGLLASPVYRESTHWVVQAIQNFVAEYFSREISLSYLARLYFLNPQYLSRLFKKETGTNFTDFVNTVRINNAKELLLNTNDDILEISAKVGFSNVTYFNRLFKKMTGVTPKAFRAK